MVPLVSAVVRPVTSASARRKVSTTSGPLHVLQQLRDQPTPDLSHRRWDTDTTPMAKRPASRPCIFRETFVRNEIDPRVKQIWETHPGGKAPFGRLRKAFQDQHCSKINPYVGGECPYRPEECGMAFLSAIQTSTVPWVEDPAAFFVKLVASTGITRADEKPLAREYHREGSGNAGDGPADLRHGSADGLPVVRGAGRDSSWDEESDADAATLRRSHHRPESVGDLLGTLALGARPRPERDGDRQVEGQER